MTKKSILLTGATGTITSELIAPLVKKYHVMCLIRGDQEMGVQRLRDVVGDLVHAVEIINGDVCKPFAGLSHQEISRLKGKVDKIVHGAASINFEGVETLQTNLDGTRNVVDLVRAIHCRQLHFQSTAYIAGSMERLGEEDVADIYQARNVYEYSKIKAEEIVRNSGVPCSIYRIGIVVGKEKTGEILRYTGYYQFFFWFYYLREVLREQWMMKPGVLSSEGITFDADGYLHFPVNVDCSPVSTLNIVPIDWLVANMAELIELPCEGKHYHLTHPTPERFQLIMEWTLETLKIKDIRYRDGQRNGNGSILSSYQGKLDRGCKQYFPYINHEAVFGFGEIPKVLGEKYRPPTEINSEYIEILMREAVRVGFRKDLVTRASSPKKQRNKNVA